MNDLAPRIASAPISWGVCEVPGWGHQMSPDRVLGELRSLGLTATELGPEGFLPADPAELERVLARHGVKLIGGFVAGILHRAEGLDEELAGIERAAATLASAGSEVLVLAADTGIVGYDESLDLSDAEWATLVDAMDRVMEIGAKHRLTVAYHPHYGTVIESGPDVERLLESSHVGMCIDTGHLMVGGADPVAITRRAIGRVEHVHLKDVDADLAARVRRRDLTYHEAAARGMYRPLGQGDVDIGAIVRMLEDAGFEGWYVLEEDAVLDGEPAPGAGPVLSVRQSLDFLKAIPAA